MRITLFLLLCVVALGIFAGTAPQDMLVAGMPAGAFAARAAYGLLAIVFAASLIVRYRGRLGSGARDALIWVGLFVAIVAGYSYRDDFRPLAQRVMAELNPGAPITTNPGVAEVVRRGDGHYVVDMQANGVKLPFVFDTGATSVVIRAEDAAKIGIDPSKLDYSQPISTANGRSVAAETRIDRLAIGTIVQTRVPALVARPGALHENLLGMSFLEKLASYGVENGRLVLRGK